MKKTVLAALCASWLAHAHAATYVSLDPDNVVIKAGGKQHVNMNGYAQSIRRLAVHAGDYPVRFEGEFEHELAVRDVQLLGMIADMLQENAKAQGDVEVLKLNARLYWIGHNLDQSGFAGKADDSYAAWLAHSASADKAAVQEEYGRFLASSAQGARAEPLLRAAYGSGRSESAFPLGMLLLGQDKKEEALALLREYTQKFPQDAKAEGLLQAVESGNFEVRHTSGPGK